jgi:hypothetical protein
VVGCNVVRLTRKLDLELKNAEMEYEYGIAR